MPTKISTRGIFDNSFSLPATVRPKAVTLTRSRTGVVLPKYKDLISKLQSATTPLSAYEQSCLITQEGALVVSTTAAHFLGKVTWTDTWLGLSHNVNGVLYAIPPSLTDTFVSSQVRDQALAQARSIAANKVKSIQTPFNTQVFAAELREIRQLFRGPLVKYLAKLQSSPLSKGRSNVVKDPLSSKDIADEWLSLQFGLTPLIRDISDISKLFNEKTQSESVNRIHAYGVADGLVQDSAIITQFTSGVNGSIRLLRKGRAEVFITSGIAAMFQEKLTGIDALSTQLTNLLEIPVTAWELLPWSFLMDYFVNVGDIINATTVAQNSISYVSETVVRTVEQTGLAQYIGFSGPLISNVVALQPVKSYKSKLRVVDRIGGSLGIPPMTVTLPGSNTRYANIAALFLSNLSK